MARIIKTDARESHDQLHEELKNSRILQGDFATKNYTVTSVRLQTNAEELDILKGVEAIFRKGYEQDDNAKTIQLPTIFAKVDGIPKDESKYQNNLDKIRKAKDLQSLVEMHMETDSDWNLPHSDSQKLQADLTVDNFITNNSWEYDILDRNSQEKLAYAIIDLISEWPFSFDKTEENIYQVLNAGFDLPREIIEMILEVDYPKQVPLLAYMQSAELGEVTKRDVISLAIFHSLGWDVIVYSPYAYASLENYLKDDEFDKFNLERVKPSKYAKGNQHSFLDWLFGK